jgi:hypothetical protein
MAKHWYSIQECIPQVQQLYKTGLTRGVYCGFNSVDPYYTIKPAGTTYLYGTPTSGKTEFWLEVLMSTTEMYGWNHVLYLPESGSKDEVIAELISKYARKPFFKDYQNHISQDELDRYLQFLNEHFFIIDPKDQSLSIEEFFQQVDDIERETGKKIDTTVTDPWNELRHDYSEEGRQDLYIENRLGFIRANAIVKKRHNCIITHSRDQHPVEGVDINNKKVFYLPPPTAREIAGGQAWYRKAMMLVCVWRPPHNIIDPGTGAPFADNEVHIIVQKFKPKGTGKKGTAKLYYDIQQNRYYEFENGDRRYSGKKAYRF